MDTTPQSHPEYTNKPAYKKAGFFERFGAAFIDILLLLLPFGILFTALNTSENAQSLLYYIIFALYGALFLWKADATPGKMLFKIKVVTTSYKPIGFWRALLRESIAKDISGLVLFLGYLWALIDKKNQTWHDKMANTFVVKVNSKGQLIPAGTEDVVPRSRKFIFWILVLFNPLSIATFFLIVYIFVLRPFQISGSAMNPNYVQGQYYLTTPFAYTFSRGDVIIHKAPKDRRFIKRIIGLPGDIIMLKDGNVYVNETLLDESAYLADNIKTYGGSFLPDEETLTVPKDSYFVLGDNRPFSSDSRDTGFVTEQDIVSKVTFCYWNCSLLTK